MDYRITGKGLFLWGVTPCCPALLRFGGLLAWQGNKTLKPPCSTASHGSEVPILPLTLTPAGALLDLIFPDFFSMSTANAPETFPILALRDFVHCAVQCCWHFPSKPDAQKLWMVIFALYFHPRLEPWALAPYTLLFCPSWAQLLGSSEDPAWVWREPGLAALPSLSLPMHTHPRLLKQGWP